MGIILFSMKLFVLLQRDEWMTLDFMSLKTMSAASLKADKETEKLLEQQKAQTIEQVKYLYIAPVFSVSS